jgi:hypothetical protein
MNRSTNCATTAGPSFADARLALLAAVLLGAALPAARADSVEAGRAAAESAFASAGGRAELPLRADLQPPRVCSPLDVSGVAWPADLSADDRKAVILGLSISGSYEGPDSWGNITGDFDGQGLSLGLLNQCLGQGSLQPLLVRLRDEHPEALAVLGAERRASLLAMLARWESAARAEGASSTLSILDVPQDKSTGPSPANRASVAWAEANLYVAGGAFVPDWQRELIALATSPAYVALQIDAALGDHRGALSDEAAIGVRELRAYLMLFDVQVQNGGMYPEDLADYAAYARRTPRATSAQKLEKLLELRIRHVRKKYAADVRARKRAIILGTGTVHGQPRNFPSEYCYDGLWPYR